MHAAELSSVISIGMMLYSNYNNNNNNHHISHHRPVPVVPYSYDLIVCICSV